MKLVSFLVALLCLSLGSFAQVPQKLSYQAVVRNNNNVLVTNANITVAITIAKDSANGLGVYSELQSPTTNANGLFSIAIGGGYKTSATNFADINWASGIYFVTTQIDPNGGNNYTINGSSQLLSVPYAQYAANGSPKGKNVGDIQYWDGTKWVLLSAANNANGSVLTLCNGLPTWGGCATSNLPVVQTIAVSSPYNRVPGNGSGSIVSAGGSPITAEGLCWSTSPNPTLADSLYVGATLPTTDTFSVLIWNMPGFSTTYYVRAYATNSYGTSYGNQLTVTTWANPNVTVPTVKTVSITAPYQSGVNHVYPGTGYGVITSFGGAPDTTVGICWSKSPNPTISDYYSSGTLTASDSFYASISSLDSGNTYYFRAYASNTAGTGYGNQISITIPSPTHNTYTIGQSYGGGTIFYIDSTKQHGLIVAVSDAASGNQIPWDIEVNNTFPLVGATDTAIGAGASNTSKTVAALGTVYGSNAAYMASLPASGYSDWYLPSKDELNLIFVNLTKAGLGNMQSNVYWSSSEYDITRGWAQDFSQFNISSFTYFKANSAFLRPIRKF